MLHTNQKGRTLTCLLCGCVGWWNTISAQQGVAIGVANPHPSAILDVSSSNQGVLPPAANLWDLTWVAPLMGPVPVGTLVYNTNKELMPGFTGAGYYYWDNFSAQWRKIMHTGISWSVTGNEGTVPAWMGLGGTSDEFLNLKRNNKIAGTLNPFYTFLGNRTSIQGAIGFSSGFGAFALDKVRLSLNNTAIGSESLFNVGNGNANYAGEENVAIGKRTLYSNILGDKNLAIGAMALSANLDSFNTAVGYNSMSANTTGTFNTSIGANASTGTNLINATAIGADAVVTTSNSMVLGGTGAAAVKVGIGVTAPSADLDIRQSIGDTAGIRLYSSGIRSHWRLWTGNEGNFNFNKLNNLLSYINGTTGAFVDVSDERVKKDIIPSATVLHKTMQLQPKTYRFREGGIAATTTYGFLAQEVEKLFPSFVMTHPGTGMKSIAYQDFGVLAIQTIREQQEMLAEQDRLMEELTRKIEALEKSVSRKQ